MKDAYGKEIHVGDRVAFAVANSRSCGSARTGQVTRFTAENVWVKPVDFEGATKYQLGPKMRAPFRLTVLDRISVAECTQTICERAREYGATALITRSASTQNELRQAASACWGLSNTITRANR